MRAVALPTTTGFRGLFGPAPGHEPDRLSIIGGVGELAGQQHLDPAVISRRRDESTKFETDAYRFSWSYQLQAGVAQSIYPDGVPQHSRPNL